MSIDVNSYNNKYNVPMQAAGQSQPGGYPMQALDAQSVQHAVDNSYLSNRVKASAPTEDDNPLAKVGLTAASWYALSQAMDKFGPKCTGKYEDSVLGRLGAWGDKVQTKFTSTKVDIVDGYEKDEDGNYILDSDGNVIWIPGLKKSNLDKKITEEYDIILKYY